jgi:hypothetical protein
VRRVNVRRKWGQRKEKVIDTVYVWFGHDCVPGVFICRKLGCQCMRGDEIFKRPSER